MIIARGYSSFEGISAVLVRFLKQVNGIDFSQMTGSNKQYALNEYLSKE